MSKSVKKANEKPDDVPQHNEVRSAVYVVASEFRDISDFAKVHNVGDDVSYFAAERLEGLLKRNLVKVH